MDSNGHYSMDLSDSLMRASSHVTHVSRTSAARSLEAEVPFQALAK